MIVLDTNVISEFMNPNRDPQVKAWFSEQQPEWLFTTSVNIGEIWFGIESLPAGRRRSALTSDFRAFLSLVIGSRLLPFDEDAALEWAKLRARARKSGQTPGSADAMIASIAGCKGFSIATRNTKDFAAMGVPLINPFEHQP